MLCDNLRMQICLIRGYECFFTHFHHPKPTPFRQQYLYKLEDWAAAAGGAAAGVGCEGAGWAACWTGAAPGTPPDCWP